MAAWYVRKETGEQIGPIDDSALLLEIQCGRVSPNALAAVAGAPQWAPVHTIPQLAAAFLPPPQYAQNLAMPAPQ